MISKHVSSESGSFGGQSNPAKEWAYFITTGIIISAIALPIVMGKVGTVSMVELCDRIRASVQKTN